MPPQETLWKFHFLDIQSRNSPICLSGWLQMRLFCICVVVNPCWQGVEAGELATPHELALPAVSKIFQVEHKQWLCSENFLLPSQKFSLYSGTGTYTCVYTCRMTTMNNLIWLEEIPKTANPIPCKLYASFYCWVPQAIERTQEALYFPSLERVLVSFLSHIFGDLT